jgi:hypothetical protein
MYCGRNGGAFIDIGNVRDVGDVDNKDYSRVENVDDERIGR